MDLDQFLLLAARPNGAVKALCRLSELAPTWPGIRMGDGISVDELDFERFVSILEVDHAYVHGVDWLEWRDKAADEDVGVVVVKNARQWKAVVAHGLKRLQSMLFRIVREDVG